ncbi:hypothetical protein ACFRAE_16570 [Sphingobacterium sp. HJSM2_6]|uniref:hypothetical protein n=1 Tax=Sphingobacterium sp. HJSM2_6 TaxID=3366264 RepID=UPI003BDC0A19
MQVHHVVLFCCNTGLAYADVQQLRLSDVTKGIDDNRRVYTNRKKTYIGSQSLYYFPQLIS